MTYSVSDANGNAAANVIRTVSVVDTTKPIITLLGSATETLEAKSVYKDAGVSASDTLDGSLTVTSVSTVNADTVGSYSVTYSVSDANGNAAVSVVRTVNVVDTVPPLISLIGDINVTVEAGGVYLDKGVSVVDALDGDLGDKLVVTNTVNTLKPGSYTVKYNAIDSHGNLASEVVRTVIVADTSGPVISLLGAGTIVHEAGTEYADSGAQVSDIVDGNVGETITVTGVVDTMVPGDYQLVFSAKDNGGNKANTVVRLVQVVDTTKPKITLLGQAEVLADVGRDYIDSGVKASDIVDGDLTDNVLITSDVATGTLGSYSVNYNVADASKNTADEVTRIVKVVDRIHR